MPIQFRCSHCGQLLSISSRKAGREVTCPQCVHRTRVPGDDQTPAVAAAAAAEPQAAASLVHAGSGEHKTVDQPSAWDQKVNAWAAEEELEEDDDFQLTRPNFNDSGEMDITPMVDVTFLLLIFFMITASFSVQKSLETTAPRPEDEASPQSVVVEDLEAESVIVEIGEDNTIRVDDVPVSGIGELLDVLRAKISNERKTELLIEAHPAAKHGTLVAVTDAGIEVQMQKIRSTIKKDED